MQNLAENALAGIIMAAIFFIMGIVYGMRVDDMPLVLSSIKIIGWLAVAATPLCIVILTTRSA